MFPRRRPLALVALLLTGCSQQTSVIRETSPSVVGAPVPAEPRTAAPPIVAPTTTITAASARRGHDPTRAPRPTTSTTATTFVVQELAQTPSGAQPQASRLPTPQAPPDPQAVEANVTLGTIEIPRIGLNKSLFEGITTATLNRGPGHWPGTALPGALGNVVVGGHRTSKSRPFRHLEKLVPGDEVIFTTGGGRFVYHVVRTEIVTPDAMWIVNQTEAYTATLFACNPVGSTKERIVVFLELGV